MSSNQFAKLTAAQWRDHVEQWRASDLTRSAYCQKQGISIHALGYWIVRHRPQTTGAEPLTLVPAKVITDKVGDELPTELVLYCPNGSQLHLPATTPAAWLGALLSHLQ
jgi:hypothetical protein